MNSFQIYKLFRVLKKHFDGEYDFFKYDGRIQGCTKKSFENDKCRTIYESLANKKLKPRRLKALFLGGFVYRNVTHISDIFDEEGLKLAKALESKWDSLSYKFDEDCKFLSKQYTLKQLYEICEESQYPNIVKNTIEKDIHFETMCLFHEHYKSLDEIEVEEFILYPSIKLKIQKYAPFLNVKKDKIIELIVDNF